MTKKNEEAPAEEPKQYELFYQNDDVLIFTRKIEEEEE